MAETKSATPRRYASITDWCEISGLGRTVTYERIGSGDLRAVKIGRRTLVDVQAGLAWIDAHPQAPIGRAV